MSGPGRTLTLDSVEQRHLGSGQGGRVGSLFVQFEFSASPACDASITIKGRGQRVDDTDIDRTLLALGYKDDQTGANATAAITANKSILVDASGKEVWADVTTVTTGSVAVTCIPLLG